MNRRRVSYVKCCNIPISEQQQRCTLVIIGRRFKDISEPTYLTAISVLTWGCSQSAIPEVAEELNSQSARCYNKPCTRPVDSAAGRRSDDVISLNNTRRHSALAYSYGLAER